MKGSKEEKHKRSAEEWVEVARKFGEKCVEIQHDPKLSIDQKLTKQKALSQEMSKEIQDDPYLKDSDKKPMLDSIKSYIEDWTKMHDIIQAEASKQSASKKSKK